MNDGEGGISGRGLAGTTRAWEGGMNVWLTPNPLGPGGHKRSAEGSVDKPGGCLRNDNEQGKSTNNKGIQ